MMGEIPVEDRLRAALSELSRERSASQSWESYARSLERLVDEARGLLDEIPAPADPSLAARVQAYLEKVRKKV